MSRDRHRLRGLVLDAEGLAELSSDQYLMQLLVPELIRISVLLEGTDFSSLGVSGFPFSEMSLRVASKIHHAGDWLTLGQMIEADFLTFQSAARLDFTMQRVLRGMVVVGLPIMPSVLCEQGERLRLWKMTREWLDLESSRQYLKIKKWLKGGDFS